MSEGSLKSAIQDGIGVIEFSHPKANSLPSSLLDGLAKGIQKFSEDSACKVILLKSGGEKAFCAGASFDELLTLENEKEAVQYFMGFAKVILAIRDAKKFVVSRVQGSAVGGAVGVIAASDLVFASSQARVKLSELALGFGPFVIAAPVKRKIGVGAFSELSFLAEWRDAAWAEEKGLFTEVSKDVAELDVALEERLRELTSRSLPAMEQLKSVNWHGTEHWDELLLERAHYTARLVLSPEVREQLQAFKNS